MVSDHSQEGTLANGFQISQSGNGSWDGGQNAWVYRFVVRHSQGDLTVSVGVDQSVPEADRDDEARKHFRAFVEALSAEVQAW